MRPGRLAVRGALIVGCVWLVAACAWLLAGALADATAALSALGFWCVGPVWFLPAAVYADAWAGGVSTLCGWTAAVGLGPLCAAARRLLSCCAFTRLRLGRRQLAAVGFLIARASLLSAAACEGRLTAAGICLGVARAILLFAAASAGGLGSRLPAAGVFLARLTSWNGVTRLRAGGWWPRDAG